MKIGYKVKIINPTLKGTKAANQTFTITGRIGEKKFYTREVDGPGWAIDERINLEVIK